MTQNSPTPEPFWFGGQFGNYTDTETGLVLCTFRYYDPATGRWISRDPIGEAGGINLYGYCDDNPVMGVDPLGLWPDGADLDPMDTMFTLVGGALGALLAGGGGGAASGGTLAIPAAIQGAAIGAAGGLVASRWLRGASMPALPSMMSSGGGSGGGTGGSPSICRNGLTPSKNDQVRILRGLGKSRGMLQRFKPNGIEEWGFNDGDGGAFRWRIAIKSEGATNATGADSGVPRFDYRTFDSKGKGLYKNPFAPAGSPGSTWGPKTGFGVNSHIPL